jgi:hypothetical protein
MSFHKSKKLYEQECIMHYSCQFGSRPAAAKSVGLNIY